MNFFFLRSLTRLGIAGCATIFLLTGTVARAQQSAAEKAEDFPGVQKALTPEQFSAAGMSKLSPEERQKLDEYLRGLLHRRHAAGRREGGFQGFGRGGGSGRQGTPGSSRPS